MLTEKCGSCSFSQKDSSKKARGELRCVSGESAVEVTFPHFSPLDALRSEMLKSEGADPEKYLQQLHQATLLMTDPTTSCFRESLALLELLAKVEEKRQKQLLITK